MLKPHDLVIALQLLEARGSDSVPTYATLASNLRMSPSEVHAAVGRGVVAGLLRKASLGSPRTMPEPVISGMEEFLIHGLKYVWPGKRGAMTRGVPTGSSLETIAQSLGVAGPPVPLVWPHPDGSVRGESIEPLYPRAVEACANSASLHEWLALVDIVRLKTGREAALAAALIHRRLA
jgi:hypothetical protein